MIFQRLVDFYDRLASDPNDPMTPHGFSRESISFELVVEPDGSAAELCDLRDAQGKRRIPRTLAVPDRGGRSGTGLKPNFLWDNSGYVLGRDGKGKPERSRQAFESFRDFHQEMAGRIDDPELTAVAKFLTGWSPDRADAFKLFAEAIDKNIAFRIRGRTHFVHQSPTVAGEWRAPPAEGEPVVVGQSLVGGDVGPLARLHPFIFGVVGQPTTGAAIASFNEDAYESYGKVQTFNAPVTIADAFKYTTALNRLLEDRRRRVQLGDATVVFWADGPTVLADAADWIWADPPPPKADAAPEDVARAGEARRFLTQLRDGHVQGTAFSLNSDVKFYILGLSPNKARLSIRLWVQSTVGEMERRLQEHLRDVELTNPFGEEPPLLFRRIIQATGRAKFTAGRFKEYDSDTVPSLFSGTISRAVLQGLPYPVALYIQMLKRLRSDRHFGHARMAFVKAYLLRNLKKEIGLPHERWARRTR